MNGAKNMKNLNLGSGKKPKEGWINVDIIKSADVICRVGTEVLPFEDNSIDEASADNFLEHLNNEQFLFAMNDIWRVLKPRAKFWIRVPDAVRYPSGAFGDPTHKLFFTEKTFDYFTPCSTYRQHGQDYGFQLWMKKRSLQKQNGFLIAEIYPIK